MRWLAWTAIALVAAWLVAATVLLVVGRRFATRELLTLVPNLVRLFRGLLRDARVPLGSKVVLGFAVVWLVSPIDLIPEFIPVLGPLDDVVVAVLAIRHVLGRAGEDVVREHWRGGDAALRTIVRVAGLGATRRRSRHRPRAEERNDARTPPDPHPRR
jgi:uncharacterized membrane protein YkvA (DUF1232 family)